MTMHTFAPNSNETQQNTSAKSSLPVRAHLGPTRGVSSSLHHLQRAIGNQAMQRLSENEAAGTASPHWGHDPDRTPGPPITAGVIQTKLAINEPGDEYEQEADRVAEQVMRMPEPQVQRACACGGKCPKCQAKKLSGGEDEHVQPKRVKPTGMGQAAVPPSVHSALRSSGQPLDPAVRTFMERRFGHDFSQVRVHSDAAAERSARDINAHAYTLGHDVAFGAGQFAPGTREGRHLLAHELTHVVQQTQSSQTGLQRQVIPGDSPSQEEDTEEMTADAPPSRARSSVSTDPDCPGYERDERSASHREPGHLRSDIERLAPDKLLIADFGVNWGKVKGSTRSHPRLQAWLAGWEADDTYRMSIVGYSDCVGGEGRNIDLRHARALNVEALLGPRARSRVTFRGMASLADYVTNNSTPANRARNRGVVIRFHQQVNFPEDEVTVTPQYCGPDSTQWLIGQMNRNRNHPVIRTQREVQWPNWIPFFNLGWNYGALSDFRDLVKAGAPWDFKSNQSQWRSGAEKTCPTTQCDKTVFLCGRCFFYDVPGNIHYGYIGRMAAIRAWFLHNRAAAAQVGGEDPAHDSAAIDIGIAMADRGASLCGEIEAHEDELNRHGTEGCGRCPGGS